LTHVNLSNVILSLLLIEEEKNYIDANIKYNDDNVLYIINTYNITDYYLVMILML